MISQFEKLSKNDRKLLFRENKSGAMQTWKSLSQDFIDPVYEATVQGTEEAIQNY